MCQEPHERSNLFLGIPETELDQQNPENTHKKPGQIDDLWENKRRESGQNPRSENVTNRIPSDWSNA